ncbi:MAG: phosphopentomutase [Clostridiales bacterium]|nr:phosphopentomutase [Clostridiales bacterium]
MKRAIIVVMDSVGMGALPDAHKYGDEGSNTLGNIAKAIPGFRLPNMQKLGLGNIDGMMGYSKEDKPNASYGRMREKSKGKDTTTGHWEMAGIVVQRPFPTYPNGFPKSLIKEFEKAIGTKVIGNYPTSGTVIINELGDEHVKTGYPIVYTSADSVFQIAAHEGVIPLDRLYEMCRIARKMLNGENAVGRVIARPFVGTSGNYTRTTNRHDFSLNPIERTVLDACSEKGYRVKAVGKIQDIFNKKGITDAVHTKNNMDGVDKTIDYMKEDFKGIIFTNLVDFDMLYGHRNDVEGYANALTMLDNRIPEILNNLKDEDLLIFTADHGCDPTFKGTDHTREYVPLLVCGKKFKNWVDLGTREGFIDLAETISEYLSLEETFGGKSFLHEIEQR